jgi:hypothetical protein
MLAKTEGSVETLLLSTLKMKMSELDIWLSPRPPKIIIWLSTTMEVGQKIFFGSLATTCEVLELPIDPRPENQAG